MPYMLPDRDQLSLMPSSVEEYIPKDDPVRAYDSMVDKIFQELDINFNCPKSGAWEYFPVVMTKLIVYGYAYGIRSSRKLERAVNHNLSFIWLTGNLKPDYRTIARFRAENTELLKDVLKKCVNICMKLNLIDGNCLFVDGSKFRANASIGNTWDEKRCKKYLKKIHENIDQLLSESEKIDREEENEGSHVKISKDLADQKVLANKIVNIMKQIKESGKDSINTTDNDCVKAKGRQGTHASFNSQVVVDKKHGLIVSCEAVSQNNDCNQFVRQISNAAKNTGKMPKIGCADSGYSSTEDLKNLEEKLTIVVPTTKQVEEERKGNLEDQKFSKENFKYAKETNEYICPAGKILKFKGVDQIKNKKIYQARKEECQACLNYKKCTSSKYGRKIKRLFNEESKERIEMVYKSDYGQEIYKKRGQTVELVYGHFKKNLSAGQFMLRGREKVNAELSILSTCFNLARMITLIGLPKMLNFAMI